MWIFLKFLIFLPFSITIRRIIKKVKGGKIIWGRCALNKKRVEVVHKIWCNTITIHKSFNIFFAFLPSLAYSYWIFFLFRLCLKMLKCKWWLYMQNIAQSYGTIWIFHFTVCRLLINFSLSPLRNTHEMAKKTIWRKIMLIRLTLMLTRDRRDIFLSVHFYFNTAPKTNRDLYGQ